MTGDSKTSLDAFLENSDSDSDPDEDTHQDVEQTAVENSSSTKSDNSSHSKINPNADTPTSPTNSSPDSNGSYSGGSATDVSPRTRIKQMFSGEEINRTQESTGGENENNNRRGSDLDTSPHDQENLLTSVADSIGLITVFDAIEGGLGSVVGRLVGIPRGQTINEFYYPDEMLREDEEVVWATNPSRWQAVGPYTLGLLFFSSSVVFFLASVTGYTDAYLNSRAPSFLEITLPAWFILLFTAVLIFFGFLTVIGEMFSRGSTWYIITDNRVIYRRNPINRKRKRINLDDINKADDRYPIPYRFVGIGSIDIYTASTDGRELRMRALQAPGLKADLIDEQRAYRSGDSSKSVSSQPGEPDPRQGDNSSSENDSKSSGFLPF